MDAGSGRTGDEGIAGAGGSLIGVLLRTLRGGTSGRTRLRLSRRGEAEEGE